MVGHCRAPGVQHRRDADAGSEVLRVRRDPEHHLGRGLEQEIIDHASTLMKMDPLVLKKVDPPVGPVWRAPTVSGVDLLVANKGRVIVPCQDRSRRRRWPKASLYKGLSLGHAR